MSDYLVPELMTEILIRLPIKSILRSTIVCKEWQSLISNPSFISRHLSLSSSSSPSTLVRHFSKPHCSEKYIIFNDLKPLGSANTTTLIPFPFHGIAAYYFRIVGVCNGLLCLSDDYFCVTNNIIIIWNPFIKRALTIPTHSDQSDTKKFMSALGFGFDSKSDDYKVVRVRYDYRDSLNTTSHVVPPRVEVFSLSSGEWRLVENDLEFRIVEHYWSQAGCCGYVHWVAYKMINNDKDGKPFRNSVLRFDLHGEEFSEMGLPAPLLRVMPITVYATMVNELFSVFYATDLKDITDFEDRCCVWVMKEYGNVESWTALFRVILDTGISRVLGVKRDGDLLFCGDFGEMVSCNPKKGYEATGSIVFCGTKHSYFVNKFAKSLVLLGKGEEVRGSEPEPEPEPDFELCEVMSDVEIEDEALRSFIVQHYFEAYRNIAH